MECLLSVFKMKIRESPDIQWMPHLLSLRKRN